VSPLPPPRYLAAIDLVVGNKPIRAEVAKTAEDRHHGMMGRLKLEADRGMLFVFTTPAIRSFWMHDTPSALSIAYIGDDGRIEEIKDMAPLDETTVPSSRPVRYALEMPQGWFAANGIEAGDAIHGLERAGKPTD
jgi:uncharacterized membrane protein (UPF0127 family)